MAISFAGVDLLLEDPGGEVARFLERYQSLEGLVLFGAQPIHRDRLANVLPIPNYPPTPRPKLNTLYWPTGATRWAMGLFLIDSDGKDDILEVVGGVRGSRNEPAQLVISNLPDGQEPDADSFRIDGQTNTVGLSTAMYLLPPRPISAQTGDERLWLLPLVDERYWWQFQRSALITAETPTWADAFTAINEGLDLGDGFSHDDVHADYHEPIEEVVHAIKFESAAYALDAVAHMVGQRVVRHIDGTLKSQTAANASSGLETNLGTQSGNWSLVAGGDFSEEHKAGATPRHVTVMFRSVDPALKKSESFLSSDLDVLESTENTSAILHSNRIDTAAGETTVDADNFLLAQQMATDFYAWIAKRYDYSFVGVKQWNPTGFDDAVEWFAGLRLPDGQYVAHTRVQTMPYLFAAVEPPFDDDLELRGKIKVDWDGTGTVAVIVQRWDGSAWVDTDREKTCRAGLTVSAQITAGTIVWIRKKHGVWWVLNADCK